MDNPYESEVTCPRCKHTELKEPQDIQGEAWIYMCYNCSTKFELAWINREAILYALDVPPTVTYYNAEHPAPPVQVKVPEFTCLTLW